MASRAWLPGKLSQVIGDILQPTHLLFILVVALLVLGPKRLPEVGRSLGRGLRDFRDAMSGEDRDRSYEVPTHTGGEGPAVVPTSPVGGVSQADVAPVTSPTIGVDPTAIGVDPTDVAPAPGPIAGDQLPGDEVPSDTTAEGETAAAEPVERVG